MRICAGFGAAAVPRYPTGYADILSSLGPSLGPLAAPLLPHLAEKTAALDALASMIADYQSGAGQRGVAARLTKPLDYSDKGGLG